ncbi:hypothetical protein [Chelativorans sp.]|uniref:hypothetical protein n=1 Tax=Chelativorans sp. TaxID=2203393 RepID=UPI00281191D2|nr:hypothetical protein [Chelativorans sp.]
MKNRRVEYLSASIMVGLAAIFALPGDTIQENEAFSYFIRTGWTEKQLAVLLGTVGCLWLVALWVNGHHRRSPVVRCMGAFAGVMIWSHLTFLFVKHSLSAGVWSTGVAVYLTLALFDLASCYRSAADAYVANIKERFQGRSAGDG